MSVSTFQFSEALESASVFIDYCDSFEDSEVADLLSRYRWDDLIANINENLPASFITFRRGVAAMEHNGMVIAQNNLVKVVLSDIDGRKGALALVVPDNSQYPYFGLHHLESYANKPFDALATHYDYSLTRHGVLSDEDYIVTAA